jgi:1-acyl-sn-glycerol-3-phosphate acyltransferase
MSDVCGPACGNGMETSGQKQRSLLVAMCIDMAGYAGYYFANVLFLLLSLPLAVMLGPFPAFKSRLFLWVARGYARFLTLVYLPRLGICRVAGVSGLENCPAGSPFICVSNHRGRLDALLLTAQLRNTAVLIKARHARFPMLAYLVQHCGFVSVDQSSAASIAAALEKCRRLLASGSNLLVFPEGTRTEGARLRRFGSIAFKVAIDAGVPVVPVVIHSQSAFMAKTLASFFPRKPVDLRIAFLPSESVREGDTAGDLCDRAYRRMSDELRVLDKGRDGVI